MSGLMFDMYDEKIGKLIALKFALNNNDHRQNNDHSYM